MAVAGAFLDSRSTSDPGAGATTLIPAFAAVIIGGLGSLWGTLLGGVVRGVAQDVGAAPRPGSPLVPARPISGPSEDDA